MFVQLKSLGYKSFVVSVRHAGQWDPAGQFGLQQREQLQPARQQPGAPHPHPPGTVLLSRAALQAALSSLGRSGSCRTWTGWPPPRRSTSRRPATSSCGGAAARGAGAAHSASSWATSTASWLTTSRYRSDLAGCLSNAGWGRSLTLYWGSSTTAVSTATACPSPWPCPASSARPSPGRVLPASPFWEKVMC